MSGAVGSDRRDRVKSYQIVSKVAHVFLEFFLSLLDLSRQHRDTMPVFVGQKHVPEYDPPPPPLTKEEQEASQAKVDNEAYNERQRVKFEIPPPRWKGKYRPKTTPKYEYVSVVPHYPSPHTREETVRRRFTTDEIQRCCQDVYHGSEHMIHANNIDRKEENVYVQKMLAPGEFLEGDGIRGIVARKVTEYIYPETEFQSTPRAQPVSLDICYHYNEDDNRVLQEFAEQGWELVSCINNMRYGGETRGMSSHPASRTFYFRRELELIPDTTNAD